MTMCYNRSMLEMLRDMPPVWRYSAISVASLIGLATLLILIFFIEVGNGQQGPSRTIVMDGKIIVQRNQLTDETDIEASLEPFLVGRAVDVTVDEVTFLTSTDELAVVADIDAVRTAAVVLPEGRGFFVQLGAWVQSWWQDVEVHQYVSLDETTLASLVISWEEELGLEPPYEGSVSAKDGLVAIEVPRSGSYLDVGQLHEDLLVALGELPALEPIALKAEVQTRGIEDRQKALETIARRYEQIVGDEMVFQIGLEEEVTVSADQLSEEVVVIWSPEENEHVIGVREGGFGRLLGSVGDEPVDAYFDYDEEGEIQIVAEQLGIAIDEAKTLQNIRKVADRERIADVVFDTMAEPQVTAAQLAGLGIVHKISEFTTYHPCCQPRVVNIQTMADAVRGHVMMPGDTFSLNEYIGQRTEEKGYEPAPSIVKRKLVDSVGGGVSQFATTMYNAIFWAGLDDITHAPHSRYFSRYPEAIEATVSWPVPNMVFRNNYDTPIVLMTDHTDTSISVSVYGNNDGRVYEGEQSGGRTTHAIVEDGGPEARRVIADVSERYADALVPTEYVGDATLRRGSLELEEQGAAGWKVDVNRIVTIGDEVFSDDDWIVTYFPVANVLRAHPCDIPPGSYILEGDMVCNE